MDMSLSKLRELVMDREPGVLQFMGLQRVGHDWATELNWTEPLAQEAHTEEFILQKYTQKYWKMYIQGCS